MIQYIINATTIWLLSLLVFDLFLRRSTHHTYNRAYLVITGMIGALLPLYEASPKAIAYAPALAKPMLAVADVKQTISTVAAIPPAAFPWASWLMAAYVLGVVVACCLLLREGLMLLQWYRKADKQTFDGYRLVVTHRNHGPFSVFGCIFISDTKTYTPDELRFVLQHEGVHIRRRHGVDKTLMLLLRCIFWIHPLLYIYYNRLMMVHEYEADNTARPAAGDYGRFLINQHLSGSVPLLAHSFFHSPLKNRIRMLTANRTRAWRKAAYFITLPAIAAFAVLWVNNTSARKAEKQGNLIMFGGNRFELGIPVIDGGGKRMGNITGKITNHDAKPMENTLGVPGNITMTPTFSLEARLDSIPVKMNGQKIYERRELSAAVRPKNASQSMMELVVKDIQDELNKLSDGKYSLTIRDLIVNESGRIVYYQVGPISRMTKSAWPKSRQEWDSLMKASAREEAAHPIEETLKIRITRAIEQSLDGLVLTPGIKDGKPVVSRIDFDNGKQEIVVSKSQVAVRPFSFE